MLVQNLLSHFSVTSHWGERIDNDVLIFYGCSNIFLINDSMNKREWTYIFGSLCLLTTLVPSFRNYRLWSFFGLVMISYTAWYMTIGALVHGQVIYLFSELKKPKRSPDNIIRWVGSNLCFLTSSRFPFYSVFQKYMRRYPDPLKSCFHYLFN